MLFSITYENSSVFKTNSTLVLIEIHAYIPKTMHTVFFFVGQKFKHQNICKWQHYVENLCLKCRSYECKQETNLHTKYEYRRDAILINSAGRITSWMHAFIALSRYVCKYSNGEQCCKIYPLVEWDRDREYRTCHVLNMICDMDGRLFAVNAETNHRHIHCDDWRAGKNLPTESNFQKICPTSLGVCNIEYGLILNLFIVMYEIDIIGICTRVCLCVFLPF